MKRIVNFVILLSLAVSRAAFADCHQMSVEEMAAYRLTEPGVPAQLETAEVTFTDTEISPDLANGSQIVQGVSTAFATDIGIAVCAGSAGNVAWNLTTAMPSGLNGPNGKPIYATGVPGIGFQLDTVYSDGWIRSWPDTSNAEADYSGKLTYIYLEEKSYMRITLFKTGDMASNSTVNLGLVGRAIANAGGPVVTVTAGPANIRVLAKCSVNTDNLNIDFGTFGPREVSTTAGPTRQVNFALTCTGVTQLQSITATLSATPDSDDSSLIKNTGAQNLAIRLREPSSDTILQPNNLNSKIVHTSTGSQLTSDFALEATVLRVGTTDPTVGKIDAIATITLSIL